jgi:hypothetical protein
MRGLKAVPFSLLCAAAVVTAQTPDGVKTHIGHVQTSFMGTPMNQGLLPTAIAEARIAAQHAALLAKAGGNLDQMKLHAGHVLHALDPSVEANGPGLGYGVKRAAAGAAQHIQLAAKVEGASKNVMTHANHVATSAGNVGKWADEMIAVARDIRGASNAAQASPHLEHLNMLAQQLYPGVDANKDGTIGWQAGEGGLQQAETHLGLLVKGEGL